MIFNPAFHRSNVLRFTGMGRNIRLRSGYIIPPKRMASHCSPSISLTRSRPHLNRKSYFPSVQDGACACAPNDARTRLCWTFVFPGCRNLGKERWERSEERIFYVERRRRLVFPLGIGASPIDGSGWGWFLFFHVFTRTTLLVSFPVFSMFSYLLSLVTRLCSQGQTKI